MHRSREEEINQVQRKILILNLIDMPGAILVGLGLYAVFGANGNAVPEALNNKNLAYGAIAVGGVIMTWCLVKMLPLLKRRALLANKENT